MRGPGRDIDTSKARMRGEASRAGHAEITEIFDDSGKRTFDRLGKKGPYGMGAHGDKIRRGKK